VKIPVARPLLWAEEAEAVREVLASGMIASGPKTAAFEERFAAYCGAPHAVATNNGTAALHAALLAGGVGPGDEVIVPSFSFIATATAVSMCGAVPVFADVDPDRFTIDLVSAEALVTARTKAVIGVHLFGQCCDVPAIADLCTDRGLLFVEDAAQAHGAALDGRRAGSFGDFGCFSFYATKNMTTGEGGMVTTAADEFDARLRRVINHGQSEKYLHTELGYNYRMTNIQGAIGSGQLKRLEGFIAKRIENADTLNKTIKIDGLTVPFRTADVRHVYNQYVLRVEDDFPVSREKLMEYLNANGIATAVHYPKAVYEQPIYQKLGYGRDRCPVSEDVSRRVMSLPVHPSLSASDLQHIAQTINCFED